MMIDPACFARVFTAWCRLGRAVYEWIYSEPSAPQRGLLETITFHHENSDLVFVCSFRVFPPTLPGLASTTLGAKSSGPLYLNHN
jgi:hypothetical protein